MNDSLEEVNIASLSPVQKMELADVLYDAAMAEIESAQASMSSEQLRELDRRIERLWASETAVAA